MIAEKDTVKQNPPIGKIKIINQKGELITEMTIGKYIAVELESKKDQCNIVVLVE